ncbi:Cytochrome P450, E-class, group I [Parasponia andersonii]|uniref:Cytochrome P450, E-class, group I n=1 Tax=Parasponia andersonii TaxID=3476 RepID=A0A2P5CAQ5_PARAD|nr:Cytochrome P450, E-class, group I [Parasponia andersonii]
MAELQSYNSILFMVCLVSTILVRAILAKTRTKAHLPPSLPALQIIGHLHLKLSKRYGPLYNLYLVSVPCIVVSSLEMAKQFLKTHETSFLNRPELTSVKHLSYPSAYFSFAPYGPYWMFMKKLCVPQLLGSQILDQLLPIRNEELKRLLKSIRKRAEAKETFDVNGEVQRITNNIISRMTMKQRCSDDDNESEQIRKLIMEANEIVKKVSLSDNLWFCKNLDLQGFGKRCKKVHEKFDFMMEKTIKEHDEERKEEKGRCEKVKDLLDISEDKSSEIRLTRENIKASILAGRRDIANLPYIQAIVKGILRLHPTGPLIFRISTEDYTINGFSMPEKTRVFINTWAIVRDPNHWENPHKFWPDRFLSEKGSGSISHLEQALCTAALPLTREGSAERPASELIKSKQCS